MSPEIKMHVFCMLESGTQKEKNWCFLRAWVTQRQSDRQLVELLRVAEERTAVGKEEPHWAWIEQDRDRRPWDLGRICMPAGRV